MGKALNDPTKGLTALRRVGVTFTKAQIKRIKALQKEGKLYEAQKIILDRARTRSSAGRSWRRAARPRARSPSSATPSRTSSGRWPRASCRSWRKRRRLSSRSCSRTRRSSARVEEFGEKLAGLVQRREHQRGRQRPQGPVQDRQGGGARPSPRRPRSRAQVVKAAVDDVHQPAAGTADPAHRRAGGQQADRRLVTNLAGGLISVGPQAARVGRGQRRRAAWSTSSGRRVACRVPAGARRRQPQVRRAQGPSRSPGIAAASGPEPARRGRRAAADTTGEGGTGMAESDGHAAPDAGTGPWHESIKARAPVQTVISGLQRLGDHRDRPAPTSRRPRPRRRAVPSSRTLGLQVGPQGFDDQAVQRLERAPGRLCAAKNAGDVGQVDGRCAEDGRHRRTRRTPPRTRASRPRLRAGRRVGAANRVGHAAPSHPVATRSFVDRQRVGHVSVRDKSLKTNQVSYGPGNGSSGAVATGRSGV